MRETYTHRETYERETQRVRIGGERKRTKHQNHRPTEKRVRKKNSTRIDCGLLTHKHTLTHGYTHVTANTCNNTPQQPKKPTQSTEGPNPTQKGGGNRNTQHESGLRVCVSRLGRRTLTALRAQFITAPCILSVTLPCMLHRLYHTHIHR